MSFDPLEIVRTRQAAVEALLESVSRGLRGIHPQIGGYVVGSAAYDSKADNRDLDILLLDLENDSRVHEPQMRRLLEAMLRGNPLEAAFDAATEVLKASLRTIIDAIGLRFPAIQIQCSFVFGPAKAETDIAFESLHVHFCGPLTLGDLGLLRTLFPFHAHEFRAHYRVLSGPPLSDLIDGTPIQLAELSSWDKLTLRRFAAASTYIGKRKWVRRLVRNRRLVPSYMRKHEVLVNKVASSLANQPVLDLEKIVKQLVTFETEKPPLLP